MKKIIIAITLVSLVFIAACQAVEDIIEPVIEPEVPIDAGEQLTSELERETDPDVAPDQISTLAADNTAFALAFYDLIRHEEENIIFSPFSLSVALGMTLAGADGDTQTAMLEALQLTLPEEAVHPAFNALLWAIEESQQIPEDSDGNAFQLNIANSIWGQAGFGFHQDFIDTLAVNYGVGLYTVDYREDPEAARVAINDWVENETEGRIEDLIPENAIDILTRLVLANAIYFNGSWLNPFDESLTEEAPFFTLDESEIMVDMMRIFDERFQYYAGENYQAVHLPYLSTDFGMTILVPDSGAFDDVEENLSENMLFNLFDEMRSERLNLGMPKFDYETTINANEALEFLGMEVAFDPDVSDFTRMANVDDLHITDVLQKANITVDEEGTEAAAATAVIVGVESAPIDEPVALTIDRPFLYMIRHVPTGTILFLGRVTQP